MYLTVFTQSHLPVMHLLIYPRQNGKWKNDSKWLFKINTHLDLLYLIIWACLLQRNIQFLTNCKIMQKIINHYQISKLSLFYKTPFLPFSSYIGHPYVQMCHEMWLKEGQILLFIECISWCLPKITYQF
jgi:hypothetical protein